MNHPVAHILVVDDDPVIRSLVADYFAEHDIETTGVARGDEALARAERGGIDLVVLDLRLDGEDGMQVLQDLQSRQRVPVILLTGRRDEADRVMGLELGADDYVTKPFSPRELLARVRAVLRRAREPALKGAPVVAYEFGGWRLEPRRRRLTAPGGEIVPLTLGEHNLLLAFLQAPGQVLSRDQLLALTRVHDDDVYDRSIDVQVLRLRRKIASYDSRQVIVTERGAGYSFALEVIPRI